MLSACIGSVALLIATQAAQPAPAGEGAVKILAWPGYIERGASRKAYDWVTPFEKKTGCMVEVVTAATSDEMFKRMKEPGSGIDLVTASGDASVRLIKTARVQAIDPARIPSWKTVDPRLQTGAWYRLDAQLYGIPYQWGPNVLIYDTRLFKKQPRSWSVLFEPQSLPDGRPNTGRIQAYDGPIAIADAALYLRAANPKLEIEDPYELSAKQYAEVLKLLRAQQPLLHRYWHDAGAQIEDFKAGRIVASSGWPYQVNALKAAKLPFASTIPREGCTGWADTTMLSADAPHPECAYLWLEWSLRPEVQAAVSEWFGSLPAVPAACKAKAPGKTDFCKGNGYALFSKIEFWKTPELRCVTQKECAPYWAWERDYTAIKAGPAPENVE
jgi:putative spermidine/putrescine transport system substrate-binding protein